MSEADVLAKGATPRGKRQVDLGSAVRVHFPTPTARDHKGANQRGDATCLPGAVAALPPGGGPEPELLPTPQARDWKGPQGRWYQRVGSDLPGAITSLLSEGGSPSSADPPRTP